jgi:hypothetical protein
MTPQSNQIVSFYDFRRGGVTQVPRDDNTQLRDSLKQVLQTSFQQRALVPIEGTPFRVFADLSTLCDGNAFYIIDTRERMGSGYVPPDTTLCSVGVACQLATAPLAWRGVIGRYISYVATAPFGTSLNAQGCMPQSLPWLCGFSPKECEKLTPDESASFKQIMQGPDWSCWSNAKRGYEKPYIKQGQYPLSQSVIPNSATGPTERPSKNSP